MIIILTNLVELDAISGEEDFQEFFPYIDVASILFNCAEPFKQIGNSLLTECLWKSDENCSSNFREKDI